MTPDVIRRVALFHGMTSWFCAVLLLVAATLFVRGKTLEKTWFRAIFGSATLLAIVSFASGLSLDEHYRMHVRQRLFLASRSLGWFFERKMHLAFGVLVFASIGLLGFLLSRNDRRFVRSARAAYVFAALFALAACVISSVAGVWKPFPR